MRKNKFRKLFSTRNTVILIAGIVLVLLAILAASLWQKSQKEIAPGDAVTMSNIFHWTGNAGDGKWSTAANWDQNRVPNANAQVTFDATSSKDSSVDLDFGGEIASLEIKGYIAKIDQSAPLVISGEYYQDSGQFEAGGDMEVNGNFTQKGDGVFAPIFGDTRIAGELEFDDGFKASQNEAMVYVKIDKEWKMLIINEGGKKDYYATKEDNAASDTGGTWHFYNAVNFVDSYVSQEKGWTLAGADKAYDWQYLFTGIKREEGGATKSQNLGIVAAENRVTIKRDVNIEEWYENTYKGIEQGFTIKERPAGNGKLIVEGVVTTRNLSVEDDTKGNLTGTLISNGYAAFRYGHLSAKDAKGKDLPVKLDFVKNTDTTYELDISVDDSNAKYPIIIDPISTTPSWTGKAGSTTDFITIPTGVANAQYGKVATMAGDVNGDGRSDFLVTARSYTNGQVNEGAAYLYYGTGTGAMPATPGWAYESDSVNAEFGHSAAAAGDVNNDGYDDIVITADGYDTFRGKIYLFLGSPSGLSKTPVWTYADSAGAANQNLGQSIAGAGDINGDGYDDIIVGAHYYSETGLVHEGAAFVFYGNANGFSSSPDWTIKGGMASALLGFSVAGAGDLDKDGYADVLVGAPMYGAGNEGSAYLYYGSATGLPSTPSQTFTNGSASSYFGNPVSPLGDVNKDGNPDILIGASRYDVGATDRGRVYAYYGTGNRSPLVVSWDKMDTAVPGAFFGCGSYAAGDVNSDGYDDVIVGSCGYTGAFSKEGKASLFLGSSSGLGAASVWSIMGQAKDAYLGWYSSTAGNVNGDGSDDFLVSAYTYDNAATGGRAYLFYGAYDGIMKVTEICNNGIDDDGNGLPDALDPVCAAYVTDQKSTITVQVSTKDESNWFSDRCNIDTNADGIKDKRNASCLPSPALGVYLQCDSEGIDSYDSQVAKNSYTYFRDFTHSPCNRDDVHDDFFNTDSTSPIFVQSVDENFTITARGQDNVGVESVQILWINANTISPGGSEWSAPLGKHTCTGADVTDCKICIKGGNCGIGNDVIDPSSLGIADGKTQQRLFFMVIVTDASMSLNITKTGYENDPVLDKYYRLHICSSACHNCVNTAPTVALDKYEEPDFCQGLGYKLYWTFTDPDGQSDYELQLQDKDNPAAPILSTVRTSSVNNVTITDNLLSGKLEYGKTYKWRVRAYDNSTEPGCQAVSAWTAWSSDLATDISFHTPSRYPTPSFTTLGSDFNTDITFTSDSTVYVPGSTHKWYIDDMATVNQTVNPAFKNFTDESQPSHNIKMSITDGAGHHCEIIKNLMLGKKYPIWNEVAPLQE